MRRTSASTALLMLVNSIGLLQTNNIYCGQEPGQQLINVDREIHGWTPLARAAATGNLPIVKRLLQAGAALDIKALLKSSKNGHSSVVNMLLENGMKPNDEALALAIEGNHTIIARLLLQAGASPNRAVNLKTPEESTAKSETAEIQLSNLMSRFWACYGHGYERPLNRACKHNDAEIAVLLMQAGADTTHVWTRDFAKPQAKVMQALLQRAASLPENYQSQPFLRMYAHLAHERAWHIEQALLATSYARLPNDLVMLIRTMATDVEPRKPGLDSTDNTHRTVDELFSSDSEGSSCDEFLD